MNLSRRNFIKIAGLSAAAVAGAALFTGCSGQLMLPVRFSATVIGKDIQKALDTKQFSVVASLKPDAQENAINAFVRRQLPHVLCTRSMFIERKTDTLDGKDESDYLFVNNLKVINSKINVALQVAVSYPAALRTAADALCSVPFCPVLTHCKRPVSPCKNSLAPRWASVI